MPLPTGKRDNIKKAENQGNKTSGFMTHEEFKQKLFRERPDVKKEYDALEPEYHREVADIKQAIGKRSEANPA
jgi:hypothetical protein